jgi:hypothetical protein
LSGKNYYNHLNRSIFMPFEYISPALGRLIIGNCHFFYKYYCGAAAQKAAVPPLKLRRHAESSKIFVARKLQG